MARFAPGSAEFGDGLSLHWVDGDRTVISPITTEFSALSLLRAHNPVQITLPGCTILTVLTESGLLRSTW